MSIVKITMIIISTRLSNHNALTVFFCPLLLNTKSADFILNQDLQFKTVKLCLFFITLNYKYNLFTTFNRLANILKIIIRFVNPPNLIGIN